MTQEETQKVRSKAANVIMLALETEAGGSFFVGFLFVCLFVLFLFSFFETGFFCVALDVLEITL